MRILFLGDIMGRAGRRAVARWLPAVAEEQHIDFVVANGENVAGGLGATADTLRELKAAGVQAFTMGNHVWKHAEFAPALAEMPEVVRPANYPAGAPGRGTAVLEAGGVAVGLVNVLGRVFMDPLDCPFRGARAAVETLRASTPVVLVDVHAEATSEKMALAWHLDGLCTAVVGTHTHVQTADARVLPGGTGFITDAGMCGPLNSVIGMERGAVVERFLTGRPTRFQVAKGPLMFSAVVIEIDRESGQTEEIYPVLIREGIDE